MWTSGAQYSDFGILLVRSDPDQPKHRGITYLLVDMTSPGIDVRPLHQINGSAHFNEVFLTDVRVPVENVIGDIDAGWGPILTTLANERTAIGGGGGVNFDHLARLAKATGGDTDPLLRQQLAEAYTRFAVLRYVGYRVQTALVKVGHRGPRARCSSWPTLSTWPPPPTWCWPSSRLAGCSTTTMHPTVGCGSSTS